jgi:hypothetical protein
MWVVQYTNIVIVLFLINAKYNKLFETSGDQNGIPVLAGKYSDFTSAWYGEVGTAIALTTFISSVAPVAGLAKFMIAGFKRCID